ncbi:MAG: ankyrin repeat domain-containing protein [Chitinispirillaceae bacterium]|nr:ankyrin repeat domain-containing protein [Chitinispirillaceae bacterium]
MKIRIPLFYFIPIIGILCACVPQNRHKEQLRRSGYAFNLVDFFRAIDGNDSAAVAGFISAGFNLDSQETGTKTTPLHRALYNGSIPLAVRIINAGASPLLADELDGYPLAIALFKGSWDKRYYQTARLLIEKGSPVDFENKEKETALIQAVKAGQYDLVRLMLEKGADKTKKDRQGKNAEQWARERHFNDIADLLK